MTSMRGRPLTELGLPARYRKPLQRGGIRTLEELCTRTIEEIRAVPHVGVKCLQAIQDALAKRGLCMADEPTADVVNCICPDRGVMEFLMGNQRGEILQCPKCSRLLYRSKATSMQTWYRREGTWSGAPTIENRPCDACGGVEPHLLKADGSWLCLACLVRESWGG